MVDNNINNAYIWYSSATDITGNKLAETLKIKCGKDKPATKDVSAIIGWGTKIKDDVNLNGIPVLNHPNKIKENRNKYVALKLMKQAGVNVAPFVTSAEVVEALKNKTGDIKLPLIGRSNYHQGGKGFWTCPTLTHVKEAINAGADYFQNMIEIKSEYRLHTFKDEVIYGVVKTKRTVEEMEDAFVKHEMDRQMSLAEKNGDKLDKNTMEIFLRRQAKKFAQDGANTLIRSNRLGWKFVHLKKIDTDLEKEAIKALKAIGLDFGAVDCCTDVNDKKWIIEVNTGPGLEETPFKAWVTAFEKHLKSIFQSAKIDKKDTNVNKEKVVEKVSKNKTSKANLAEKVKLMQDMVAVANDEEAVILDKVFAKMFS